MMGRSQPCGDQGGVSIKISTAKELFRSGATGVWTPHLKVDSAQLLDQSNDVRIRRRQASRHFVM